MVVNLGVDGKSDISRTRGRNGIFSKISHRDKVGICENRNALMSSHFSEWRDLNYCTLVQSCDQNVLEKIGEKRPALLLP